MVASHPGRQITKATHCQNGNHDDQSAKKCTPGKHFNAEVRLNKLSQNTLESIGEKRQNNEDSPNGQ
jgi:uncharacterized protein YecT (DUF1311 family)